MAQKTQRKERNPDATRPAYEIPRYSCKTSTLGAVIESFATFAGPTTDAERMRNEAGRIGNDMRSRARGDAARIVAEGNGAKAASVAQANGRRSASTGVEKTIRRQWR